MHSALFVFLGGLLGALAVALGAIGAHALETRLTPERLETFHTGVHYLMIHALGLILVGLVFRFQPSRRLIASGWLMLIGTILFSGFLFAWLATGVKFFVLLVPVGGVSFILGWLALVTAAPSLRPSDS